jgi:hypothetical protein
MTSYWRAFAAACLLAGLLVQLAPSHAASVVLCRGTPAGDAGARRLSLINGGTYQLDPLGCAAFSALDAVLARAQGFTPGPDGSSIVFVTGVASGTTSFKIGTLPASAYIREIIVQNLTNNSAGNVSFGTSSGAADVAAAACAANCLQVTTDANLLKRIFSTSVGQPLFVTSSGWNSANLVITVAWRYF